MRRIPLYKFEEYLLNKGLSENAIDQYLYYFNKFTADVLTQETMAEFFSSKSNRNVVARSFIKNLQQFIITNYRALGFSVEERLEAVEMVVPVITGSGQNMKKILEPLSLEEIFSIEKQLPNEKLKIMLLLSFYGGLRVGELLKLRIDSFKWGEWKKDRSAMIECRVEGKGNKMGIALFPSHLAERLIRYIYKQTDKNRYTDPHDNIFMRNNDNNIKSKSSLWGKYLDKAAKNAGITDRKVHPHILRHSMGTYLMNNGMDIRKIQELMRHSSIRSTQIYTHVNKEKLKEELSKIY